MITIDRLINEAKHDAKVSDWPYGESYFKAVIAHYNPTSNRTTFTIDYKRATKKQVEEYLSQL